MNNGDIMEMDYEYVHDMVYETIEDIATMAEAYENEMGKDYNDVAECLRALNGGFISDGPEDTAEGAEYVGKYLFQPYNDYVIENVRIVGVAAAEIVKYDAPDEYTADITSDCIISIIGGSIRCLLEDGE